MKRLEWPYARTLHCIAVIVSSLGAFHSLTTRILKEYFKASNIKYPLASRPTQGPQLRERVHVSVPVVLSQQRAYTPALQLVAVSDVGGRPHLSPRLLPFASVSHSTDGATTVCSSSSHLICSLLLIYRPRKDERLSWPSWLTYSGWFTHINGYPSAAGQVQAMKSLPTRDQCLGLFPVLELYFWAQAAWNRLF